MLKRLFAVMLAVVMIISIAPVGLSVFAEDLTTGQIGADVYYSFNNTTGTLTVSGTGNTYDYTTTSSPFYNRQEIKTVIIESGVTNIGANVLSLCKNMTGVVFSDTITSIGAYAFAGCVNLTDVVLPDSLTGIGDSGFSSCKKLTSIDFPDSLTGIGRNAFSYSGLESVFIPANLSNIGRRAFANCESLITAEISSNNEMTVIPEGMFSYCSSLKSVKFSNYIVKIENYGFGECSSLETIYYTGTPEEFAEINIEYINYSNRCLKNASVIYVDDTGCDHDYELTATVEEPGCETPSYKEYTCTICGKKYKEILAPAVGHNFGEYTVTIKPTCVEPGVKVRYCTVCGKAEYEQIAELDVDHNKHIPGPYQVIKNPTVNSPGAEAIYCTRCETYYNQRAIPKLNPDLVISISLSSSKEVLLVGETSAITATVTPENTENKNVIWTSSDTGVADVYNGVITANAPGAAVIIAETEDGGYKDFCLVQVFSVNAQNGAQIDSADGFIYGLAPKLDSVADYLELDDESVSLSYSEDVIGTGTKVYVKQGSTLISEYQVVIFGDVNGDGIYDGQDAFIVNCLANGALTREQVGEAKYLAADCNHDGLVNSSDVLILEQAGLLLANVDQSKDDYIETDAYAEYLDLIDQTPTADEAPVEEPTEPEAPAQPTFIQRVIEIIRYIVNFIRSLIIK